MNQPSMRYKKFWATMFGYSLEEMARPGFSAATSGYYIERHEETYVFFWTDLVSKKHVLAASEMNLTELQYELLSSEMQTLDLQTIRSAAYFRDLKLTYKDIDFGLLNKTDFKPVAVEGLTIKFLTGSEKSDLEQFYADCSEKDQDTLDLTFDEEVALGLYSQGRLTAISRYAPIRDSGIADITVVVRKGARGLGYSTPLVSEIIRLALEQGYEPKYRVDESNGASIAIANRLGFKPLSHILAWEVGVGY
jgi:RimJ/RimL family protein N-acetyltransferase